MITHAVAIIALTLIFTASYGFGVWLAERDSDIAAEWRRVRNLRR